MQHPLNIFLDHTESIVQVDASVANFSEYIQFWEQLLTNHDNNSAYYVIILISKIYLYSSGLYKTVTVSETVNRIAQTNFVFNNEPLKANNDPECTYIINTIYNSILYVTLNYSPPRIIEFQNAVVNWNTFTDKTRTSGCVNEFLKLYLDNNEEQIYMWLVEKCFKIDISPTQYLICSKDQVAMSIIHSVVRDSLYRDPRKVQLFYDTVAIHLAYPNTTRDEILSLLHIFKQFITLCPNINPAILSSVFSMIKKRYYLWPKPYSDQAREVLELLSVEQKEPGAALRDSFLSEIPSIFDLSKPTPSSFQSKVVHVIFDQSCPTSTAINELLRYFQQSETTIVDIQSSLLSNIFELELKIEADILGLELISSENTGIYFKEAMRILNESVMMNESDANSFKKKHLNNLKDRILTDCMASNSARSSVPKLPKLPSLKFEIQIMDNPPCNPDVDLVPNTLPRIPKRSSRNPIHSIINQYSRVVPSRDSSPLKTEVKLMVFGNDLTLHNIASSIASLYFTHEKLLSILDFKFYFVPVEISNFGDWLGRWDKWYGRTITCFVEGLLHLYPSIVPTKVNTLRTSSPAELADFSSLSSAGAITSSDPKDANKQQKGKKKKEGKKGAPPKLEPSGSQLALIEIKSKTQGADIMDGALAEMQRKLVFRNLAQHSTYRPSSSRPPSSRSPNSPINNNNNNNNSNNNNNNSNNMLSSSGGRKDVFQNFKKLLFDKNRENLTPNLILRNEIENYCREAKNKLLIKLFQCECWINDTPSSDYTIPFLQTVELGYSALNRALEEETDDVAELPAGKIAKQQFPSFSLKYSTINPLGVSKPGPMFPAKTYSSLMLSNISSIEDEFSRCAFPFDSALSMTCVEVDSKKKKITKTNHVQSVEMESNRTKMNVLIDDQLYGPFFRIRVTQCITGSGVEATLPVMTFLPITEPSR